MKWNPTGKLITDEFPQYQLGTGNSFDGGNYLLGGKHFIYIVKGESWVKGTEDYINDLSNCDFSPNYDESAWIYSKLKDGSLMLNMRDNRNRSDKSDTNGRAVSITCLLYTSDAADE